VGAQPPATRPAALFCQLSLCGLYDHLLMSCTVVGSTIGYPSNSWAFCTISDRIVL